MYCQYVIYLNNVKGNVIHFPGIYQTDITCLVLELSASD